MISRIQNIQFGLLIGLVCLSMTTSSPARQFEQSQIPEWHFTYELFQMLLEQNGLQAVKDFNQLGSTPAKCVIVAMGDNHDISSANIQQFTRNGGAILLATDQDHNLNGICRFRGGPVVATAERDRFQGYEDCLVITDLNASDPLTEGVQSLIVNRSGWLEEPAGITPAWHVAARLPEYTKPANSIRKSLITRIPNPRNINGLLLACGDQSLFTNGMLWHGDNAVLAINVSRMLAAGRRKLLFLVDGKPLGSYQDSPQMNASNSTPPNTPDKLPEPGFDTMLRVANSVIKNVEQSNLINEALANRPRNMSKPHYRRAILFTMGALVLGFVIWKLSGKGPTTSEPMPTRRMLTAHALLADQKINATELGTSASMLARDLCRELTGSSDSRIWLSSLSPDNLQDATPEEKTSRQKRLTTVLDLAVKTGTVHIPQKKFLSVGTTIQELRQLHRNQQLLKSS